jgi:hypothetical protein
MHALGAYFDVSASLAAVRAIVEEAAAYADKQYVMDDALNWALEQDGTPFRVPQQAIRSDYKLFQAHTRDIDSMMTRRAAQILDSRLNKHRIAAVISADNPDRARLIDLAAGILRSHRRVRNGKEGARQAQDPGGVSVAAVPGLAPSTASGPYPASPLGATNVAGRDRRPK